MVEELAGLVLVVLGVQGGQVEVVVDKETVEEVQQDKDMPVLIQVEMREVVVEELEPPPFQLLMVQLVFQIL
jgi:hypothetical protein